MASGASDPFAGRRWGEWVVVRRIAVGGMAEIFEARAAEAREDARSRVALKVVLPQHADDPEFRRMLADEAELQGRLAHPNLVRVLGHGEAEGRPFLAMELVDGPSLAELLRTLAREKRPCPPAVALFVGAELLRGLAYVHEATDEAGQPLRIVHRDVNPPNVLLERTGRVRLGDFGIARSSGRETRTQTGVIKGKLRYLAPEQVTGSRLDARTDVYAAGLVLWELLAGEPHLVGEGEIELMRAAETPTYRPLADRPGLDARFDRLLSRALARFPEERWGSARAFLEALEALRGEVGKEAGEGELAELVGATGGTGGASGRGEASGRADGGKRADERTKGDRGHQPPGRTTWRIPPATEPVARRGSRGPALAVAVLLAAAALVTGWWLLYGETTARPDAGAAATAEAAAEDGERGRAAAGAREDEATAGDAWAGAAVSPEGGTPAAAMDAGTEHRGEAPDAATAVRDTEAIDVEGPAPPADAATGPVEAAQTARDVRLRHEVATESDAGAAQPEDASLERAETDAATGPAADAEAEAPFGPDPAEVRGRLERARGELRGRGVLLDDLPSGLRAELRGVDEALAAGRTAEAQAALDGILPRLAEVVVDGPFVRAKLERVEAALAAAASAGRDVGDLEELAATALQEYLQGRYDSTNRKLNEILGRLRASGGP